MISLFEKNTVDFNNNGKVLNQCIAGSDSITESTEGIFDLEFAYPIQDTKKFSQYLVNGNIVRSPVYDSRPDQLFRIRKTSIDSSGSKINVYAQAIGRCDLMNDFVFGGGSAPLVPSGKTRKQAIALVLAAVQDNVNKFHVGTLDTSTNTNINLGLDDNGNVINYIDVAYTSPLAGILDNSSNAKTVYNAYSGEVIYNNFEINMVDERGTDNTFTIKSGKNLQEFQQDIDDTSDDFATVLIMKSSDGIYLPNNEVITSPNVAILGKKYKIITCEDVSAVDDTTAALNIVYEQLRERGQNKFTKDGIDALTISNTVKFAQLKKTEQYKDYNILEKCELGNNVTIVYSKLNNLTVNARITRIVYSPLALNGQGKITEVTIGNRKKANIANIINNATKLANSTNAKTNTNTATIKKVKKNTDEFKVTMEARANEIELSVANETEDRIAAIEVLDGEIELRVEKDDFGSYITQHYNEIVEAIIDATGSHQFILNTTGATVKNGGFKILDSNDNIVFSIDSEGTVNMDAVGINNLSIRDTSTNSMFFNTLANMDTITTGEIKPSKLTMNQGDFYINSDGYGLKEYVQRVVDGTD